MASNTTQIDEVNVMENKVKLAVVIVNYKTPDMVIDCVQSLLPELREMDARVVIVDNLPGAVVAVVQHPNHRLLQGSGTGGNQPLRQAGNLQHRPGLSVHQPGLHRHVERQRHPDQHGRQGLLA